ncbi:lactosylceramide 4-alpha-galactosyltransferase-like [Centruroides sculpturatus]|uniref:lactosylceramide 4-alpha-galactosyltransferase-like n=1 Tax=Centruroides sculpturatus TaxID=218467 RepID=UPI000C6ED3D6|nr:lactosylceramide 4-alpha-galactosyltransferase-like [Centruroides sculpturatus]
MRPKIKAWVSHRKPVKKLSIESKTKRKLIVGFGLCFLLLLFFYCFSETYNDDDKKIDENDEKSEKLNIFFFETSGASSLNIRQICAVESTARHNPSANITVFMFTSRNIKNDLLNVHMRRMSFEEIFVGTPLEDWYFKKEWKKSKYKTHHLSDAVRYAVIWRYGGIYLDLDIVMLKPLPFTTNFVVKSRKNSLCNGIFGMQRHHSFLYDCMKNLSEEYKSDCFVCVGPRFFTKHFLSYCRSKSVEYVEEKDNCNITILQPITVFPVPYSSWKYYFTSFKTINVLRRMKNSYMIHVWNKFSSGKKLYIGSGSSYEIAIAQNCPHAYSEAVNKGEF